MICPACGVENPDAANRCGCGYSFATTDAPTAPPQPVKRTQPASSGPTIGQAFIWGIVAAAFGTLCAWLGKLLSAPPQAPPAVDPLHGLSSPAQMNAAVDALLSAAGAALAHDHSESNALWIIVAGVCLLSLASAFAYIWLMRTRPVPSGWRTFAVILMLGLPPVVFTTAILIREDHLFQASPILHRLENENTHPSVVSRGKQVDVRIAVMMQSFFGYYKPSTFSVTNAGALLTDGSRAPLTLGQPTMSPGGRKPGATDVIPLMEDVKPWATFTVPDDARLDGAIIVVETEGTLNILPQEHPNNFSAEEFQASTKFRVATPKEVRFASEYAHLSENLGNAGWLSWPTLMVVILGIVFGTPGACKQCQKKVNRMLICDGHLCRECFNASQAKKPAATGAA